MTYWVTPTPAAEPLASAAKLLFLDHLLWQGILLFQELLQVLKGAVMILLVVVWLC